jgi:hypothetical protein
MKIMALKGLYQEQSNSKMLSLNIPSQKIPLSKIYHLKYKADNMLPLWERVAPESQL